MEAEALEEQRIVNGVQVDELFVTIDNIKKAPVIAKFKFRANNKWIEGGHNRADVCWRHVYGNCFDFCSGVFQPTPERNQSISTFSVAHKKRQHRWLNRAPPSGNDGFYNAAFDKQAPDILVATNGKSVIQQTGGHTIAPFCLVLSLFRKDMYVHIFQSKVRFDRKSLNYFHPIYFLFILSILFSSCAPLASDYRREGFNFLQRSFESFKTTKDLNVTVVLKNVKIHIGSDRKHFPWDKASAYGSPVAGYATSGNEIFVFGKRLGGKIIVNQAILGHELNHLLNFQDPKVSNPDELDQLEICYINNPKGNTCEIKSQKNFRE